MAERWKRLADEIYALAGRRRISLSELCRQTGISRTALYRRLAGDVDWERGQLEEVARVLGIGFEELMLRAAIPASAWEHGEARLARDG